MTLALPDNFSTFDTLTSTANDSAAERVRSLVFNSLVRKNEILNTWVIWPAISRYLTMGKRSRSHFSDSVKFHNGREFTSADVKYTFDELFESKGFKAGTFYDTVPTAQSSANTSSGTLTRMPR